MITSVTEAESARPLTLGEQAAKILERVKHPDTLEVTEARVSLERATRARRIRDYLAGKSNEDTSMRQVFGFSSFSQRRYIETHLTLWEPWRKEEMSPALIEDLLRDMEISCEGYDKLNPNNLSEGQTFQRIVDTHIEPSPSSPLSPLYQPYVAYRARPERPVPSMESAFSPGKTYSLPRDGVEAKKLEEALKPENDPNGELATAVWLLDAVRGQIAHERIMAISSMDPRSPVTKEIRQFLTKNQDRLRKALSSPLYNAAVVEVLKIDSKIEEEQARLAELDKLRKVLTVSSGQKSIAEAKTSAEENLERLKKNREIAQAKAERIIDEILEQLGINKAGKIRADYVRRKSEEPMQELLAYGGNTLDQAVREQLAIERAEVQGKIHGDPDLYFRSKVENPPLGGLLNIKEIETQIPVLRRATARLLDSLKETKRTKPTRVVELPVANNPNERELVYTNQETLRGQRKISVVYDETTNYPRRVHIVSHTNQPFEEYEYTLEFTEDGLRLEISYQPPGTNLSHIITQVEVDPNQDELIRVRYMNTTSKDRTDRTFVYKKGDFGSDGNLKSKPTTREQVDVAGILTRITDYLLMQDERLQISIQFPPPRT